VATSWLQEMCGGSELKKSTPPIKASPMIKQKSRISKILEEKKGFLKNSVKADFLSTESLGFTASFLAFLPFDFIVPAGFFLFLSYSFPVPARSPDPAEASVGPGDPTGTECQTLTLLVSTS